MIITQVLSDKEIVYLYREILIYWENGKNRKFNVRSKPLQDFLQKERIQWEPATGKSKVKTIQQCIADRQAYFSFKVGNKSQPSALLCHLRNAVAHCNIKRQKIKNQWFYVFTDHYQKSLTMTGKVPVRKIEPFIKAIKSSEQ